MSGRGALHRGRGSVTNNYDDAFPRGKRGSIIVWVRRAGRDGVAIAELRRRGIETVTVDKVAEGTNTSRAAVMLARTLEVLKPLGGVPTMPAERFRVPGFVCEHRAFVVLIH